MMETGTCRLLAVVIVLHLSGTAIALKEVRLNSTLIRGHLALPQQQVVFTCVARNSTILEWQSNEHIGTDGDNIQIYSVGPRDNVTSVTIPTTYATRVSVTMENGITVIVSRLFITTSERFPTSSVTCQINGRGPIKTIPFNTTVRALQGVMLNSTLIRGVLAYSQQRIVFTCVARNSTILEWQSNEHIGTDGDNIQIYSVGPRDNVTSVTILTTYATRDSVTMENGITVIVSQLFITASEEFPTSSITCRINGQGPMQAISFNTTDENPPVPKFNSTLHEGVSACPGDRHQFKCTVSYSHTIEWTSEEYIGGGMQITSSTSVGMPLQASRDMDTYAVLDSRVELENGWLQLTTSLNIMISSSLRKRNHTVTCLNIDLGTQQSINFQMAESCDLVITVTSKETESDQEGDTSPAAGIISGSIIGIVLIIIIIGIIILTVIMYVRNPDGCKVAPNNKPQVMTGTTPPPAVLGVHIDFPIANTEEERPHEKQAEAEMDKDIDESGPQVSVENSNETGPSVPQDTDKEAFMTAASSDVNSKIKRDRPETNGQLQEIAVKAEMEKEAHEGSPQIETEDLGLNIPPEANNIETDMTNRKAPSADVDTRSKQVLNEYVEIEMENDNIVVKDNSQDTDLTLQESIGPSTNICSPPGANKELSSANTSVTTVASHGTQTDSDSAGEDAGGQSPYRDHAPHSSVLHTLNRQNSNHIETEA